jgi:hypothetical protein
VLAYGSQGFLDQLKERFLHGQKDAELPQQNRLLLDSDQYIDWAKTRVRDYGGTP